MSDTPRPPQPQPEQPPPAETPCLSTRELFRGAREIWIEHDGVLYRLRLTRRNKLILQK